MTTACFTVARLRRRSGLPALMLLLTLPGCQQLQGFLDSAPKPSASVSNVHLKDLSLSSVKLVFDVDVTNPYSVPLPLVNLDYALSSKGQALLSGKAAVQGAIPAGQTKTIPLPADVSFATVLSALKGVKPGAVVPYQADLKLSVDAPALGTIALPLSKQGQLPIPAPPGVELTNMQIRSLSLDQASAVLQLKLTNANQFPVDLNKLGLTLSLGGTKVGQAGASKPVSFDAGGQGALEVPISFSPAAAGLGLFRMLSSDKAGYQLEGLVNLNSPFGPMELPFNRSGETKLSR